MKRIHIVFIILALTSGSLLAQNKKKKLKRNINPFEMVHVGDSVTTKLYNFIASTGWD